jgi:hypothetical protein
MSGHGMSGAAMAGRPIRFVDKSPCRNPAPAFLTFAGAGKKRPAEVWSPLPGTEQQWHGAGSRAWWAGACLAAMFAISAVALAWAGLLLRRDDPGSAFGIALLVGIIVLNFSAVPWCLRQYHRKIARAGEQAGLAGTGEQHSQPTR